MIQNLLYLQEKIAQILPELAIIVFYQNGNEFLTKSIYRYSPGMIFKIIPKYKSKSEGDKIQLKDIFYLENIFMNTY